MRINSLMELTMQMDALTSNSRSVLNALIRSTVTAGSHNGFTVNRAGVDITLSRVDIFRLYSFYRDWECVYGFSRDEFDGLLATHDTKYANSSDGLTTAAVVKHAKVMYMNLENAGTEDDTYWIGLVRDNATPKALVNACPVPINLRSPIYDENLSTKHFSQFETYLFPAGYNALQIAGYRGDNTDHVGGGKSWHFGVDGEFGVDAGRVVLGRHSTSDIKYSMFRAGSGSFMQGSETYAYGPDGIAMGRYSVSVGQSSAAIGEQLLSVGDFAGSFGGKDSISVGIGSATVGGSRANAVADYSFATGNLTSTGGARLMFTRDGFQTVTAESMSEPLDCDDIYVSASGCQYRKVTNSDGSQASGTSSVYSQGQFRIPYVELAAYGLSALDFELNDEVILYAFRTSTPGQLTNSDDVSGIAPFYGDGSHATKAVIARVVGISRAEDGWLVTVDKDISLVEGLSVTAGYVTLYKAVRNAGGDLDGMMATSRSVLSISAGMYSTAMNHMTVAKGVAQTVVGSKNISMFEPRFIVGSGNLPSELLSSNSSYIWNGNTGNSLVSGPRYSYMKVVGSYIYTGVADHTNSGWIDAFDSIRRDEALRDGVNCLDGAFSVAWKSDLSTYGISRVSGTKAQFTVSGDGLWVHPVETTGSSYVSGQEFGGRQISTLLGGVNGATVIYAGTDYRSGERMFNRYARTGSLSSLYCPLMMYSADGIGIEADATVSMTAHAKPGAASAYVSLEFDRLKLDGNTYGALPTTDECRSHDICSLDTEASLMNFGRLSRSGFYFNWTGSAADNNGLPHAFTHYVGCEGYHALVSAYVYKTSSPHYVGNIGSATVDKAYDVSGLILPGAITQDVYGIERNDRLPHIKFFSETNLGDGNEGVEPGEPAMYEELAYMSDLMDVNKSVLAVDSKVDTVVNNISIVSGTATTGIISGPQGGISKSSDRNRGEMPVILLTYDALGTRMLKRSICAKLRVGYENDAYSYHDGNGNRYVHHISCSMTGNIYELSFAIRIPEYYNGQPIQQCNGIVFPIYPTFRVDGSGFSEYESNFSNLVGVVRSGFNGSDSALTEAFDDWQNATASAKVNANGAINVMVTWKNPISAVPASSGPRLCTVSLRGAVPFRPASFVDGFAAPDEDIRDYWTRVGGWSWTDDVTKVMPTTTLESTWSLV